MFKRSFISIYFLEKKLLILELSSSKKKVLKSVGVETPEGMIEKAKVADVDGLAQILKNVWSKFHIRERAVGIILPESSTFTKFFKLPNLPVSELPEAVNWQIQEFLPGAPSAMITDWKIIDKKDDGYEIQIVAVSSELLSGYVSACEKAGLFPLAVETPSICLIRLAKKDEKDGNLIVYKANGETLLILFQGEKIVGTSVVKEGGPEQIAKTSSQMIRHFRPVKVSELSLGGTELTEEIVSGLTDQLKIQFSLMKPRVSGIEEGKLQEYLVPLSMQFAEPAEPSDPKSLNLLPNSLVDKYKRERLRLQVWGLTLTITLFTSISFLVTLGAYLFMVQNINNLKEGSGVNQEFAEMRKESLNNAKAINKVSDRILDIKKVSVLPQQILNAIQSAKPEGVTIQSYTLDLDRGQVSVTGISSNRNSLIEFKERLEADGDYVNVTIPISNFEQEVNLEFTLSFQYKPVVPTPTPVKRRPTPTT